MVYVARGRYLTLNEEPLDPIQPTLLHPALNVPEAPLLVVGIGGAAGGLDALRDFLAALNQVTEGATGLVVMLALQPEPDPTQSASLIEAVRAISSLPVRALRPGEPVVPDHVYVVPADLVFELNGGGLQPEPPNGGDSEPQDTPVDRLFRALAHNYGARAVGIVLSGAGTDGTHGVQAISNAGGMTAAQSPTEAQFDSMPRSAMATGIVDHVLDASAIAEVLIAYAGHVQQLLEEEAHSTTSNVIVNELRTICEVLRDATDHDFRHYKTSTLLRRIQRRMQVTHVSSASAYVELLRADPSEVSLLFRELLIGVTSFFRDPHAFDALHQQVIEPLLRQSKTDRVRIWVPGCSTGEEAYSLAIVLHEALQGLPSPPQLQIFATDIDERALSVARLGIYPASIAETVSKERLERYFIKRGKRYEVVRELRELCLFTPHNLINDPPFSRLDLVSCRNLLIYFGPHLQAKLIPIFHYALRRGGVLFLGNSENITSHDELFTPVDAKHCIFQRKETALRVAGLFAESGANLRTVRSNEPGSAAAQADLHSLMQRMLLDEFAPKSVIVTHEGRILSASGSMERYLTVSEGTFQNNVVRLARPSLRLALRAALKEAADTKRRVVNDRALLPATAATQRVRMTVQPMPRLGEEDDLFLVVFEDMGLLAREDISAELYGRETNIVIGQLERELASTRDQLEQTIQDLEVANAELKSGNQELLAMNEELRSANEELEISKEDVHERNRALATAHTVLANLMSSTAIATIFLDEELRVQSFTPSATQFYNLQQNDVGRPISHVTHRAIYMPPLPAPAALAEGQKADEHDVEVDTRTYLRRVHPYTNPDGKAEGIVVNFMDVTALKHAVAEARQHRKQLELITDALPVMISYVDANERYGFNNAAYEQWFGVPRAELLGRHIREILGETAYAVAQPYVQRALAGETTRYEAELVSSTQGRRSVMADYVPDIAPDGKVRGYFSLKQDITERRVASLALAEAKRAAEAANLAKSDFLANMSHEIRTPMSAILGYADLLFGQLDDPDNLSCLEAIRRNGQHLIELLNDILDLSKIEAGMLEAELLRFAPDKLLREVVEDARVRASERGLSLELSIDGPLPQSIQSDPTRLRQILLNLLSNAIKFTSKGGVRVRARLRAEACLLEICVTDSGIGIPEELAQQLFEPFTQADNSITRRYGGTGLGLTITKRLVQVLGGEIAVHNEAAGGASFVFTVATGALDSVPLTSGDAAETQRYTAARISVKGARVLVVDDRRDMRYLLQTFLEEAGAQVATAANGREALQKAQETGALDAIVLDMQMPEMDGFAAAKRLRELGYRGKLIALTASAMTSDRERCIAAGCDEYMSKPVDRARLLELIAGAAKTQAYSLEPKRVLIVDDNEDAAEVLAQLLGRGAEPLQVTTASTGSEALELARTRAPSVVILDLGLPDLDGYEVLARLKALPELRDPVFIALTGRASSAEQARALQAGFAHYFVKPADLEALRRAVRAAS
jgi:two-component system, chemotaxis family, CheB/CheR fusion protein